MADSKTEIANMALGHLAVSRRIANVDTDQSAEAGAVRAFWGHVVEETLRDGSWSFALSRAPLALVAQRPTRTWGYAYAYPADAIFVRRIPRDVVRPEGVGTEVAFSIGAHSTGQRVIYTDEPSAIVEYVRRVEDVTQWPADFTAAVSALLAFYIAPAVTAGDQFRLGDRARAIYEQMIRKAHSTDHAELRGGAHGDPTMPLLRERGYYGG